MKFLILLSIYFLPIEVAYCQTKVIAHRGAWKEKGLPQNSIASLNEAIRLRCAGSEFDVRMTKDNILVINHDPTYQGLEIEDHDYETLKLKKLSNGEKLPTLDEYLRVGKSQKNTTLVVEIKPSPAGKERSKLMAEMILQVIKKLKMEGQVVYISFDIDVLKKIDELDKNASTQYLNGDLDFDQLTLLGINGVDYHYSYFIKRASSLQEAKSKKLVSNAWTVNDSTQMEYFMTNNIDFLTTDEPALALKKSKEWMYKKMIWSEEFAHDGLPDSTHWEYDVGAGGWGNNEKQTYTYADSNNVWVKTGSLKIKAIEKNGAYSSARLRSKMQMHYGRLEIRAKLAKGRGIWPAIWMLGDNIKEVGWPKCGEIDIMEHVGYDPDTIVGTIHTVSYNHMRGTQISQNLFVKNPYTEFHIYGLNWTASVLEFLYDGKVFLRIPNPNKTSNEWPFDHPFYLLLNVAIGGNWGGAKGIDPSIFPAQMEVDYVRLFKN